MRMSGTVNQLAEILVHRDNKTTFRDSPREDVNIGHPGISVANVRDVMAKAAESLRNRLPRAHIHEQQQLQTPTGRYTRSEAIVSAAYARQACKSSDSRSG